MKCPKCQIDNPDTARFCSNCATSLTAADEARSSFTKTIETPQRELATGSVFANRYQVIEELGKGGMGKVYRVLDKKLNEEVALKLVKPEIASDKKTLERFKNELKLARKVSQKNVGRMFDLGEENGTHYITMEYVPGEDLKSFIRRVGQIPIGKSISIAKQLCEGLSEAHGIGIIHRDLKPSNIMIDKDGNARIMDFGIARSLKGKGITGAGVMIGTPEYMSPEQVEGKDVEARSDIYSLGIILYEMLTGKVPFEGETPFSVGVKQKSEAPEDPRALNPSIPADLSSMILKCLEKEEEHRYKSTEELRSELGKIEQGVPTSERVVSKKTAFTSKEITVSFNVRKAVIPVTLIIAVVLAAVLIWKPWAKRILPSSLSDKPSLAVMYFKNNTGDKSLDHWRATLSDSIIIDLSQSKYLEVLSSDQLYSILRRLNLLEATNYATEDLKKVASEGGVNYALLGSFSKAGDTFRVEYLIQEISSGKNRGANRLEGRGDESIFSMVDEITRKIKQEFDFAPEKIAGDIDRNIGTITTSSPEALNYYSIGRNFQNQREHRKTIEVMEQAVAIDPEFAMAYRAMATAYWNLGYRAKANEFYQKALEFKDRLSDREQYLIEADFYGGAERTYDKSIEAYEKLLEIYPDNTVARNNLGWRYSQIEEYQKAIEHFKICIEKYRTTLSGTYSNLAVAYRNLGLYDKAKEIYEDYSNNFPDIAGIHRSFATLYLYQGKYELALEEMDKAFALAPTDWLNLRSKGDIYLYMGDLKKAEEEYRKLLEKEEPVAYSWGTQRLGYLFGLKGRFKEASEWQIKGKEQAEKLGEKSWVMNRTLILADMDVTLGRPEEALKKCEIAWKSAVEEEHLNNQRRALNIKALAYLEMERITEAQRTAAELEDLIERGIYKNQIRLYYHLMGRIALEKNNYAEAIEFFNKGLPCVLPTDGLRMVYADSMGLAFFKSGDLEKAREEYENIGALIGRTANGDIYAKSFYMLGKIYEQQNNQARAIENYEKFLDLWKDADPGLPEVEDASKRLAGLGNN